MDGGGGGEKGVEGEEVWEEVNKEKEWGIRRNGVV